MAATKTLCGPIKHLIVQPTPFCNIDCTYCYLRDREHHLLMQPAVLDSIAERVIGSSYIADELNVAFHAGEPLAAGLKWFEYAIAKFESCIPQNKLVTYSIQTNATLINDSWADLFIESAIDVSVSLDGPAQINDRQRLKRNGKGTHTEVVNGVGILRNRGIPFSILCVLTKDSLDYPDQIFQHFLDLAPERVCFNIEEIDGINTHSSISSSAELERCFSFFQRFWDLAEKHQFPFEVREFDQATGIVFHRLKGLRVENSLTHPLTYMTISSKGDVSTFAPELINFEHDTYKNFSFGNILNVDVEELVGSPILLELNSLVQAGVQNCEKSCSYFEFCRGGSPSNKIAEHGSLLSTETWWCRTSVQLFIDLAINRIQSQALDYAEK